jgi:hypothetical protein
VQKLVKQVKGNHLGGTYAFGGESFNRNQASQKQRLFGRALI